MSVISKVRGSLAADNFPTVTLADLADEIVDIAIHETDFISELAPYLDNDDLKRLADEAVEQIAEVVWIAPAVQELAKEALALHGRRILQAREADALAELRDGVEAGDLSHDGEPLTYLRMH